MVLNQFLCTLTKHLQINALKTFIFFNIQSRSKDHLKDGKKSYFAWILTRFPASTSNKDKWECDKTFFEHAIS